MNDKTEKPETPDNLFISFSGRRRRIRICLKVFRILNYPSYICFRVNKDRDSIVIFPCDSKDVMSYKVPTKLFDGGEMTISSKSFVNELVETNELNPTMNYMVPGQYLQKNQAVLFNLKDAFEHPGYPA